jgi:TRAP-type mannitol/chloroaromatic compound transport system permease large subunit
MNQEPRVHKPLSLDVQRWMLLVLCYLRALLLRPAPRFSVFPLRSPVESFRVNSRHWRAVPFPLSVLIGVVWCSLVLFGPKIILFFDMTSFGKHEAGILATCRSGDRRYSKSMGPDVNLP